MADHDPADQLRERVREHYAAAATAVTARGTASCCTGHGCGVRVFGDGGVQAEQGGEAR